MSAITLYEISIATFVKGLKVLDHILNVAETHAREKGDDVDSIVTLALVADMKPLSFQVQVASNTVKKSVWRLTGIEIEAWEDQETTLAGLKARVQKTLDLVQKVDAGSVDGKENHTVELQVSKAETKNLPAKTYVLTYAIPNFFFHLQTAYAILRAHGVPLGKSDYLGGFMY